MSLATQASLSNLTVSEALAVPEAPGTGLGWPKKEVMLPYVRSRSSGLEEWHTNSALAF